MIENDSKGNIQTAVGGRGAPTDTQSDRGANSIESAPDCFNGLVCLISTILG